MAKNDNKNKTFSPEPVNFVALVLGFSSAALTYLGEALIADEPKPQKNLPLAKQNIDILNLLKEKTTGNLTPEENRLLDHVLGDLQLKYVTACKQP